MKLSKRLQAVATLVDIGSKVIDIGCDHAYLDIYLTLNNDNKCLATDINENALAIAIKNIEKAGLKNKIRTKLTDGLINIKIEESDTIVIAGMGAHTILNILNQPNLPDKLIISSNNNWNLVREEIVKMGYIIESEIFLVDKYKPYIIIKFIKGIKKYKKTDYTFGPILKYNSFYRKYLINKYKKILKDVPITRIMQRVNIRLIILKLKFMQLKKS